MTDEFAVQGEPPARDADPLRTRPKAALFASRLCPIYLEAYKVWLEKNPPAGPKRKGAKVHASDSVARSAGRQTSEIVPSDEFLDAMLKSSPDAKKGSPAARSNWRHGGNIRAETIEEINLHLLDAWPLTDEASRPIAKLPDGREVLLFPILLSIRNDSVSFEEFAAMVGLSKEAASRIVDPDYFVDAPLLTDMYYKRRTAAESKRFDALVDKDFARLRGCYLATIPRTTSSGRKIQLDLKIHVKYVFDYRRTKHLIRTKLIIPYYVDEDGAELPHDTPKSGRGATYDGWVRIIRKSNTPDAEAEAAGTGDHIVWIFQKRRDRKKVDFEFMITALPEHVFEGDLEETREPGVYLTGRFLTLDQEGRIHGGEIALKQTSNKEDAGSFMDAVEWRAVEEPTSN